MQGLKVHAFSGLRPRSGKESGWSLGGTSAAFIVSVLRYFYGDQFDYNALQEFKALNMIEDWEPREDLLADGVLVGQGDGVIFFPEGFDSTGWDQIYSSWKAGKSVATAPSAPTSAALATAQTFATAETLPTVDAWSFESNPSASSMTSNTPPAAATLPELVPATPPPGASTSPAAPPSPATAQSVPMPAPAPGKKKDDNLFPWLALAGGGLALLLLAGKGKK